MKLNKDDLVEKKRKFFYSLPYSRLVSLLFLIFVSLAGVNLYFTNLVATSGVRLTATARKIESLEQETAALENDISRLGSVSYIKNKAEKLGFVFPDKINVLITPKPVAIKP